MIKIKFIQNLSIKNKIVAIILLVTYLSLGIGFAFVAMWDISRLKSEIQSNLVLNAKLIGDYCVVPLTFDDNQQATKVLSRLRYIKFIETACIFDKEGKLFVTYSDTVDKSIFLPLNEQPNSMFKNGYFYVQVPIQYQNEMYGTICLKANSQPLTDVKRTLLITLSLLTLVLVFLSFIMAGWMQRFLSVPIIKLKDHFDKISKSQDFSVHIQKMSDDETGSLYDGFNKLINQINLNQKERDKAVESLRESEEKYRKVSDNSPAVLYRFRMSSDGDFSFSYVSNKVLSVMGINSEAILKDPSKLLDMVHPDDREYFYQEVMKSAKYLKAFPVVFRCIKEGEIIWIEAHGTPTPMNDGGMLWDGFLLDITERKLAEMEIKKLNEELEERVNERTKELKLKYSELEKMNQIFIGRELKMIELKSVITKLEQKTNDK
ncbi:MAG: PAS domain-containing protein [Bacteroidales bacterium]|nr:PAS domain-containing protein [Bacteroidales bacterium]